MSEPQRPLTALYVGQNELRLIEAHVREAVAQHIDTSVWPFCKDAAIEISIAGCKLIPVITEKDKMLSQLSRDLGLPVA